VRKTRVRGRRSSTKAADVTSESLLSLIPEGRRSVVSEAAGKITRDFIREGVLSPSIEVEAGPEPSVARRS
jgi:hypothetical protein